MEEDTPDVLIEPSRVIKFTTYANDDVLMVVLPQEDSSIEVPRVDEVITLPDKSREWRVESVSREYVASERSTDMTGAEGVVTTVNLAPRHPGGDK